MAPHIAVLQRLKSNEVLTSMTTAELVRNIRRRSPGLRHLTAHSIKRGAVVHLVKCAIRGQLEPRLIPLLAKHKDALHDFPSATLGYIADPVATARLLGTQLATRLL